MFRTIFAALAASSMAIAAHAGDVRLVENRDVPYLSGKTPGPVIPATRPAPRPDRDCYLGIFGVRLIPCSDGGPYPGGTDDRTPPTYERPDEPDQPEEPCEKPDRPQKPDRPGKPEKPGKPDKPSKPSKPEKPKKEKSDNSDANGKGGNKHDRKDKDQKDAHEKAEGKKAG